MARIRFIIGQKISIAFFALISALLTLSPSTILAAGHGHHFNISFIGAAIANQPSTILVQLEDAQRKKTADDDCTAVIRFMNPDVKDTLEGVVRLNDGVGRLSMTFPAGGHWSFAIKKQDTALTDPVLAAIPSQVRLFTTYGDLLVAVPANSEKPVTNESTASKKSKKTPTKKEIKK